MSKTTTFLILVAIAAGLAIGILTDWNPITTIQGFIAQPATILPYFQSTWQLIQQNILGFVTGLGGMFLLAAKAISSYKSAHQKIEENLQGKLSQVSEVNAGLKAQVDEKNEIIMQNRKEFTDNTLKLSNKLVETQDKLEVKTREVTNLEQERNYFAKKAETAEDLLKKYQQKFGELYVK